MSDSASFDAETGASGWDEALLEFPVHLRDVYFSRPYVALHQSLEQGARAVFFVFRRGGSIWAYPFVMAPIPLEWSPPGGPWYDIQTAYGYGGPLSTTDDPGFIAAANRALSEWAQERSVVAEFVRLHPLFENQRWLTGADVSENRSTVSLRLDGLTADRPPFDKDTRRMILRAAKSGVTARETTDRAAFRRFVNLYLTTMRRVGAQGEYYFTSDYFDGVERLLGDRVWLLEATLSGQPIAASLFLVGSRLLHYHLSASLPPEACVPGTVNHLVYSAALLGAERGLSEFHLGGGRTAAPGDSLLRFKQSMATRSHRYCIATRIHDDAIYRQVCRTWAQAHPELVPVWGHRFLAYRYVQQNTCLPPVNTRPQPTPLSPSPPPATYPPDGGTDAS